MKGEFEFIEGIRRMFPSPQGVTGIGDDCAVITQNGGMETLVSTDMLVEGTHFLMNDISPYNLGWKAAAASFSDIAAMGATPTGSFLAVALPRDLPSGWEDEFLRGYREISDTYGFPLLGGDTCASKGPVCVCVTVLGSAPAGKSRRRNVAVPGDLVCVTGTLGDSAAGLEVILKGLERNENELQLIDRHYLPHPRIAEGKALAGVDGVHAMIDISDGIGSDLCHIIEESGTGAEIDLGSIPLSKSLLQFCEAHHLDPYDFAISGGEDYELLFTVSPLAEPLLEVPHSVIGRITTGSSLIWKGSDRLWSGYRHL